MAYSFDDADAAERHDDAVLRDVRATAASTTRAGPRCTRHSTPWVVGAELPALDDDVWELYAPDDWTQAHDLAAEQPEQARRAAAAVPDRGRQVQRAARSTTAASSASTPTSPAGRSSIQGNTQLLFGGMGRLTENSVARTSRTSRTPSPPQIDGARRRRRRA